MIVDVPGRMIYLANRHPRLTRAEFRHRWARHGQVGTSMRAPQLDGAIESLRYCLTVDPAGVLDAASNEHDGVALIGLTSVVVVPTLDAMLHSNDIAYADELRTFERPAEHTTLYAATETVLDGAESDVVVLHLQRRRPDCPPGAFLHAAHAGARAALDAGLPDAGLRRWVRNVVVAPPPRGFGYDLVEELWFPSIDAVAAAAERIEDGLLRANEHAMRGASTLLVAEVATKSGPAWPPPLEPLL